MLLNLSYYCITGRNDSQMVDKNAQIRLVMAENLDLGTVEARVCYECEGEINSIPFPLFPTSSSTVSHNNFNLSCFYIEVIKIALSSQ